METEWTKELDLEGDQVEMSSKNKKMRSKALGLRDSFAKFFVCLFVIYIYIWHVFLLCFGNSSNCYSKTLFSLLKNVPFMNPKKWLLLPPLEALLGFHFSQNSFQNSKNQKLFLKILIFFFWDKKREKKRNL